MVAIVGFALALGDATPLASWTFALPGFNLFRIPGRHAFELTFALSILAGLGIAALARKACPRVAICLFVVAAAIFACFATVQVNMQNPAAVRSPAVTLFAIAFAIEVFCLVLAARMHRSDSAAVLGCVVVLIGVWPFAQTAYWRDAPSKQMMDQPPYASLLKTLPLNPGQRIYSATDNGTNALQPNLPMLWALPELGGYTQLQLATVALLLQTGVGGRLLDPTSPIIDLAGVRYEAVNAHPETVLAAASPFAAEDLGVFLSRGRPEAPRQLSFGLAVPRSAQRLGLVTALGTSVDVAQDTTIAVVSVFDTKGGIQRFPLRAGRETAEFAYDRADVKGLIRHRAAVLFDRYGPNRWYQSYAKLHLCGRISSISIQTVDQHTALNVRKISLINDRAGSAYPISFEAPYYADRSHFAHVRDIDGVSIFKDIRAFPAVWIPQIVQAENVFGFGDDRLATLREKLRTLDLRRMALVDSPDLTLPTRRIGEAHILHNEPERRDVDVMCSRKCLLVSNEAYTGGWTVVVDGSSVPLVRVDGLLQGVFVPAGHHQVAFRYRPIAYRRGVALSLASLASILLWLGTRRRFGSPRNEALAMTSARL